MLSARVALARRAGCLRAVAPRWRAPRPAFRTPPRGARTDAALGAPLRRHFVAAAHVGQAAPDRKGAAKPQRQQEEEGEEEELARILDEAESGLIEEMDEREEKTEVADKQAVTKEEDLPPHPEALNPVPGQDVAIGPDGRTDRNLWFTTDMEDEDEDEDAMTDQLYNTLLDDFNEWYEHVDALTGTARDELFYLNLSNPKVW